MFIVNSQSDLKIAFGPPVSKTLIFCGGISEIDLDF